MSKDEKENPAIQDSLVQMYTAMKEKTVRTIDSLVTNYPDCHATALIINNFVIKDRDLEEVEKMYEGLSPRIKNAYLGRKLKTSIDNVKKTSVGSVAPDFTYKPRMERTFLYLITEGKLSYSISGHLGVGLACGRFLM